MASLPKSWKRAVDQTISDIQTKEPEDLPEYRWLFELAGRLRGVTPGSRSSDTRQLREFLPAVKLLAHQIERHELSGGSIDWEDIDSLELLFEQAWKYRKHVQDSELFGIAIELSKQDWLNLPEDMNKWVARMVNLGFCLQEAQPDNPFLIPVSETTADMLGTSIRTLGIALNKALEEKYLKLHRYQPQVSNKRFARRINFNYSHPEIKPNLRAAKKKLAAQFEALE